MSYTGFVCQIKNLRNHPNGDNLYLGECFGNTVAVSRNGYTPGMTGVYFPTDGQLSAEFCQNNNLLRLRDENGHSIPGGGYMDPDKRNVTAIKLRGEKSDGLFLPITCLESFGDTSSLKEGDRIDVFNGHEICKKYVPRKQNRQGSLREYGKTRKKKVPVAPLFAEHADTEQLAYNLGAFKNGDQIEITLKMHGTSQRTGYLPTLKGYKRTIWDKLFKREGTPIYDWGYVSGTRRTVLENFEGGYYGSNEFREQHSKFFEGKLNKGETVYYEVVGFTHTGTPIMSSGDNKKLNDKEFVKQYGATTIFSYGCYPEGKKVMYGEDEHGKFEISVDVPQSDIYVYRMTMTNEDGFVVEYTPDFMRYRCEQMGVKTVMVFEKFTIPAKERNPGEYVLCKANKYYDGPDPVGKNHIREGVVCRILNRPGFVAYKAKNWFFKALEGIVKVDAEAPDMEEAQDAGSDEVI